MEHIVGKALAVVVIAVVWPVVKVIGWWDERSLYEGGET